LELRQSNIPCPDSRIWKALGRHIITVEAARIRYRALLHTATGPLVYAAFAAAIGITAYLLRIATQYLAGPGNPPVTSACLLLTAAVLVIFAPRLGIFGVRVYKPAIVLVGISSIALIVFNYLPSRWLLQQVEAAVLGVLLAAVGFILLILILSSVFNFSSNLSWRGLYRRKPESVVIDSLARALVVASSPERWINFDSKKDIILQLERSARAIEIGFPSLFRDGDSTTELWLMEQAEASAAHMREFKRWVVTPRLDSREEFIAVVTGLMNTCISGHWDCLRANAPEGARRLRIIQKAANLARVLVVGTAPLIAVLILVNANVLKAPISTPLLTLTGVLAAIALLRLIDPQLVERLGSAKDVASFLRQGDESK
jgi:hypothetical protein